MSDIPFYAIDFETYYEPGLGIKDLGVGGYVNHPKFDAYMVSLVGPGIEFVGHPKDAPWDKLPAEFDFVAHNMGFDRQVYGRLQKDFPGFYPSARRWWCTANLAVYLNADRNLKGASAQLLGIKVDKQMRGYMNGKTWADAVADGKDKELLQYALDDSKLCWELWNKYNHLWPEAERQVAEITYLQTVRGLGVDELLLDKGITSVAQALKEASDGIPWYGTLEDNGDEIKPTAVTALRKHCDALGIPRPKKTAADEPELVKWMEEYPVMKPILLSMQQYRSTNALLKKALVLKSRIRETDGRFPFEMKYGGAHTLRWSGGWDDERAGSTGFNIQNLPGEEMYGLDLRHCLIPSPENKFVIADFSQIEPRCLLWLVDDWDTLGLVKQGFEIYEAYARKNLGWSGGNLRDAAAVDPGAKALRKLAKAACLGAGYGCAAEKFIKVAKLMADLDLTPEQAAKAVGDFRRSNPKITQFWRTLEMAMKREARGNFSIELPSGRSMTYYDVKLAGGLTAVLGLGGKRYKFWGGVLTENVCQAVARDVIRDAIINLEAAGITTLFTVHDEVICEVPVDFDSNIIRRIMVQEPSWMPGIPLDVSLEESAFYKK